MIVVHTKFEKDEKQRADFAFQMHQNYCFYLTKLGVPCHGPESFGSIVLDTRPILFFSDYARAIIQAS